MKQLIRNALSSRKTARKSKGFTLVEFILVAGLVAVGLVVAFNSYQTSKITTEVNTESRGLQSLNSKIKSIYAGRNSYTGISTAMLIAASAFPAAMVDAGAGTVANTWGGAITVGVNAAAGFDITYTLVPTAACIELVNAIGASYRTVTVAGTVVKAATDTAPVAATVTTQCTSAGTVTAVFNGI